MSSYYLFAKLLLILAFAVGNSFAQCETVAIPNDAGGKTGERFFWISFNDITNWDTTHKESLQKALNAGNWMIFSPTLLQKAKSAVSNEGQEDFLNAASPSVLAVERSGTHGVILVIRGTLRKDEKYYASLAPGNDLVPAKCDGGLIAVKLSEDPPPVPAPQTTPPKESGITLADAPSREKADIYIEGIAEGARKSKTAFTVDASISKKLPIYSANPDFYWKPFFNFKASTNPEADLNSMNFGVEFGTPTDLIKGRPLSLDRIFFTETAKIEADRDFKSANIVGDFRALFSMTNSLLKSQYHTIEPFVGFEVGKNLKSPLPETRGNTIARPLFGAQMTLTFYPFNKSDLSYRRALTWEVLYERRFPLTDEIALDSDDDGNPVSLRVEKGKPRDWFKSGFTYNFATNFGFTLKYEYGGLPPLFKKVDSKFSVGLVFKGILSEK